MEKSAINKSYTAVLPVGVFLLKIDRTMVGLRSRTKARNCLNGEKMSGRREESTRRMEVLGVMERAIE